jgi:predicted DNA-binding transcriptional regulator AlpA
MAQPEDRMNAAQTAEYMGTSVSYLYKLRCQGRGPYSYKTDGKHLVYNKAEVDAWLYRRRLASMRGGAL